MLSGLTGICEDSNSFVNIWDGPLGKSIRGEQASESKLHDFYAALRATDKDALATGEL